MPLRGLYQIPEHGGNHTESFTDKPAFYRSRIHHSVAVARQHRERGRVEFLSLPAVLAIE